MPCGLFRVYFLTNELLLYGKIALVPGSPVIAARYFPSFHELSLHGLKK